MESFARNSLELEFKTLLNQENILDSLLVSSLPSHETLSSHIDALSTTTPQLQTLSTQTLALSNSISRTCKLSTQMSSKVRLLDLEQSRIQDTISLIDNIIDIKTCATNALNALSQMNIPQLAIHINQFLKHDPLMIKSIFETDPNSPQNLSYLLPDGSSPIKVLLSSQKHAISAVSDAYDEAVSITDKDAMIFNLKLFPLLGQTDLGLQKFSKYLTDIISRTCQDGIEAATAPDASSRTYVDLITKLYEIVALIIDQQSSLVESIFGPGMIISIINTLTSEADKQISIFMRSFSDHKQLTKTIYDIKNFSNVINTTADNNETNQDYSQLDSSFNLNSKQLDSILADIAVISQKSKLFQLFIQTRIKDSQPIISTDISQNAPISNDSIYTTNYTNTLKELLSFFISIQDFYIKSSVTKALSMDSVEKGSLTSSCVDDVFFILKSASRRAFSTGDLNVITATLSSAVMCLEQEYLNYIIIKFNSAAGTLENKEGRITYIYLLNNIDVSCDNISKLIRDLEIETRALNDPDAKTKMNACFTSMNEEASSFKTVLKNWNEGMFVRILKTRIKPILMQAYGGDIKYILTEDEYYEQQSLRTFMSKFMVGFSGLASYYKRNLTENNYNQLFMFILDQLFRDWEKHILGLRFNLLGATRFDEDLRAMTAYLATLTSWSFREKFTKLNQIAMLLNFETLDEIYEYWGARNIPMAWKLSIAEIKSTLALRRNKQIKSEIINGFIAIARIFYIQMHKPNKQQLKDNWTEIFENGQGESLRVPRVGYVFHPQLVAAADKLPSNINRSSIVHKLIQAYGLSNCFQIIKPNPASKSQMLEFHTSEYLDYILRAEHMDVESNEYQQGIIDFGLQDDCPVFEGMACYVSWISGATISAAKHLCSGKHDIVIFWDGGRHHSKRNEAAGFCYVNDIVLGIFELHTTFQKVLYIDIDIHHGDGVQSAFEFSPRVFTLSFHRFETGFFPGTGSLGDIGYGKGKYHSLNVPLRTGLSGVNFLNIFTNVVGKCMKSYNPDAIVMQCGADGLAGDPLGGKWNLDIKSVGKAVRFVLDFKLPTMLLGGGGYKQTLAARCWAYLTAVSLNMDDIIPKDIPEHDHFTEYGPDFTIWNDSGIIADRNELGSYSDNVIDEVSNLLDQLNVST